MNDTTFSHELFFNRTDVAVSYLPYNKTHREVSGTLHRWDILILPPLYQYKRSHGLYTGGSLLHYLPYNKTHREVSGTLHRWDILILPPL